MHTQVTIESLTTGLETDHNGPHGGIGLGDVNCGEYGMLGYVGLLSDSVLTEDEGVF